MQIGVEMLWNVELERVSFSFYFQGLNKWKQQTRSVEMRHSSGFKVNH